MILLRTILKKVIKEALDDEQDKSFSIKDKHKDTDYSGRSAKGYSVCGSGQGKTIPLSAQEVAVATEIMLGSPSPKEKQEVRDRYVESIYGMICQMALKYANHPLSKRDGITADEYFQAGLEGAYHAFTLYNFANQEASWQTYAKQWIRVKMSNHAREMSSVISHPTNIGAADRMYAKQLPDTDIEGDERSTENTFIDPSDLEDEFSNKELFDRFKQHILKNVGKKYEDVFQRVWIDGERQAEVAQDLGLTNQTMSARMKTLNQYINAALEKLRPYLKENTCPMCKRKK